MAGRMEFSYSIWLVPEGEVYERLLGITHRLSQKHKSPQIRPHVTLVGGFTGDIEQFVHAAERLAQQIRRFPVRLTETGQMPEFFRSLFLKAEKTPELMAAYRTACKAYSLPVNPDYLPHLSMIYGDFDTAAKNEMIRSIENELALPLAFEAGSLHAVINNERHRRWPEVAEFPLG